MEKEENKKSKITIDGVKRASKIFSYIGPYRFHFILALVLTVLGSLLVLAIPGFCSEMVNVATGESEYDVTINQLALALLVLIVLQACFSFCRTILFAIVSENGMADIRSELYNKLITMPITFYEKNRVGELISHITSDVDKMQGMLSITIAEFLRQIVMLIGGFSILIWLTPKLSLIMILSIPVVMLLAQVFGRYIRRLSKERQKVLADTNTIVDETLHNFSAVKAYTNEKFESDRYKKGVTNIVDVSMRYAKKRGLFFAYIISIMFGSIIFIIWRAALMVQNGEMASGTLFGFVLYTGFIAGAIGGFANLYATIASAIGAIDRVFDIMDNDAELEVSEHSEVIKLEGNINFKEVGFYYPTRDNMKVLDGINLQVKPGNKVALVGQSGSGKSTIARLLIRFYNPTEGSITIDDKDIREYDIKAFRHNIAIVPQEVLLFGGTIHENILYGNPKATEAQVLEAAELSNSIEFINSFPEKFETIVGERGIKLSGGQRQRIAIARAILKDPSILILDEATSSLDAESERLVQEALNNLMRGRTSIIIAHRLATIRDVDQIFVMEGGKIIEQGKHDELYKADGVYAQLAKLQFD